MATFDIASNVPFPPPFRDEDHCCQDEQAWANGLFENWFASRELYFGNQYHLAKAEDGTVLVCFKSVEEALWFKSNHEAAR